MQTSTRRTFMISQTAAVCCLEAQQNGQTGLGWPTSQAHWPRELAGIRIVDSKFTKIAAEALLDTSPPYLVNHAARTFFFGAMIGRKEKRSFDVEVLFLASALHDLGLTEKYAGPLPFEIQGAEAAKRILSEAGLGTEKTGVVWDGIAMHCLAIGSFKQPEIVLVGAGAGADVVGGGIDDLPADDVTAVLNAFPRLQFKQRFVQRCGEVGNKYPRAAKGTFMRDIAERTNPQYRVGNICDAIAASKFSE